MKIGSTRKGKIQIIRTEKNNFDVKSVLLYEKIITYISDKKYRLRKSSEDLLFFTKKPVTILGDILYECLFVDLKNKIIRPDYKEEVDYGESGEHRMFVRLPYDILKFFDDLGFNLEVEVSEQTGQHIEDYYGRI